MLIDATHAEETRVVVVDGNKVEEFDFESENKRQLAGNIYLAKVTRVEPSLQAAFVDYGGNRHGFLAFSEIHPDYYQIPVADREALMEEERAYADAMKARDDEEERKPTRSRKSSSSRSRSKSKAAATKTDDVVETKEVESEINGMETIDLSDVAEAGADVLGVPEGTSPMELVDETPVEEPEAADVSTTASGASDETAQAVEEAVADSEETLVADSGEDLDVGDAPAAKGSDAASKDDSIESVAEEDDIEDIRPPRKPRPRRYKIQEVVKVRQILLVQVVKEERGNKGAALTTYLSLAGRYCVLMPNTARGGGISRKITNAVDRKKLKDIASEIEIPQGAGLIVRTAGAKRTKAEIKRDYEYLQRLWEQIRELTLKSIAPAKIYEEGDLIKRSIRDLYNREIDEVLVEGERGYRIAKDFMKMIMPSHAKNVKQYTDTLPLFARYQVESYLGGMFNPTVQLKSGGYIVIGVTEALVAIDVNSGRATKEGSIEDTATKTNLEAAEEVARQLRLRDLAGLIVIDFIDMDERKNNAAVEKRMKDKLKTDRARIQVGRISGFGLMEMSRQRLRPGMIEATTQPCPACHGTGLIRSDDNMALSILRQIEEEGTRRRSREILVRCPVSIANFLMNAKREHIAQIEARYGISVRIEGDPHLVSPDFTMEKFKTATRSVPVATAPVVSVDTSLMDQIDADGGDDDQEVEEVATTPTTTTEFGEDGEAKPKRKRRRRRRRPSKSGSSVNGEDSNGYEPQEAGSDGATASGDTGPEPVNGSDVSPVADDSVQLVAESAAATAPADGTAETASEGTVEAVAEETPAKPASRSRSTSSSRAKSTSSQSRKKKSEEAETIADSAAASAAGADAKAEEASEEVVAKPKPTRTRKTSTTKSTSPAKAKTAAAAKKKAAKKPAVETAVAEAPIAETPIVEVPVADTADAEPPAESASTSKPAPVAAEPVPAETPAPKRRGWWSLGR
mgnify:CR=1 FL=1